METTTHRVHADEAGRRLDRFLRKALPDAALGAIFKLLRTGRIRVNGQKAKPENRIAAGDEVQLRLHGDELARLGWRPGATVSGSGGGHPDRKRPTDGAGKGDRLRRPPPVLHRDEHMLVLAKPAGLATQGGTAQGDLHVAGLLPDWLAAWGVRAGARTFRPAPAHRLDKGTSGCLAVGLTAAGLAGLVAAFREHRAKKTYLAVAAEQGPPLPDTGVCQLPLNTRSRPGAGRPRTVADPAGQPATTHWQVLARGPWMAEGSGGRGRGALLLALWPRTGRNHQIRAHCAALQVPLLGDPRYGGPRDPLGRPGSGSGMPYLHAFALELPHPADSGAEATIRATAPLPSRWFRLAPWLPEEPERLLQEP